VDLTPIFNKSGKHVATIGFDESCGFGQIALVERASLEFFCPSREIAFAAWHDEFDPETGLPRPAASGRTDA